MSNFLMILKTQNLRNDQRVLKEIRSLTECGANVNVLVAKDCDMTEEELNKPMKEISIFGGAAPRNIFIRILGVFDFYIKSLFYIIPKKKKINKYWICDPIMFGLILLIKLIDPNSKIIWDHHELPPTWFLKNKLLLSFFKLAYRKADIVIHCNQSRKDYLENLLNFKHGNSYVISNYPDVIDGNEEEYLNEESENWINNKKFVYLQNCLQEDRNGAVIIKALIGKGYYIYHAGKINKNYLETNGIDPNHKQLKLGGYLSFKQINRVLKKCEFTVICYKKNSLNQIYCDANRLYQAMALGTPLIIGDNPSMIESTINYHSKIILEGDGSEIKSFSNLPIEFDNCRKPLVYSWKVFYKDFQDIVKI
ncbi:MULTISPECIES: glycosyl transferase family 1 [unclassified Acinetobacter]|uniref:glycosyl transferase family 1 n=1 Tax=unclassified Acinetobacter TaxID=196816 RepID=UPI0015D31657|nr:MULTISPECIES: glycosyl transferase family 1 [unclassified Acinetobacter]